MQTRTPAIMAKQTTDVMDELLKLIQDNPVQHSLQKKLQNLNAEDFAQLKTMLRIATLIAKMHLQKANGTLDSYDDLVKRLFKSSRLDLQAIITRLLEDTLPELSPRASLGDKADFVSEYYSELDSKTAERRADKGVHTNPVVDQIVSQVAQENGTQSKFLDRLKQSESSNNHSAEVTLSDGRRFVGALQFGEARLSDYKQAKGVEFNIDEFKNNPRLQEEVTTWHIADIDEAIDKLNVDLSDYSRDGLRAVAHLGGKAGMKKFVQSKGDYNPADELGTSLQSYYDKFSHRGDA